MIWFPFALLSLQMEINKIENEDKIFFFLSESLTFFEDSWDFRRWSNDKNFYFLLNQIG